MKIWSLPPNLNQSIPDPNNSERIPKRILEGSTWNVRASPPKQSNWICWQRGSFCYANAAWPHLHKNPKESQTEPIALFWMWKKEQLRPPWYANEAQRRHSRAQESPRISKESATLRQMPQIERRSRKIPLDPPKKDPEELHRDLFFFF